MTIIKSTLRAVVERVTQIEWNSSHIYVFEHLDEKGVAAERWIQNWECDDITNQFTRDEKEGIYYTLIEYYKSKANSKD